MAKKKETKKKTKGDYKVGYKKPDKRYRFSSENQPKNRGRKGKSITQYLKDLGDNKAIEFEVTVTKKNGEKKKTKGKVESVTTLNELLANQLWADALNSDGRARKEIIDRLEGRPQQSIDLTSKSQPIGVMTREEKEDRLQELIEEAKNLKKNGNNQD